MKYVSFLTGAMIGSGHSDLEEVVVVTTRHSARLIASSVTQIWKLAWSQHDHAVTKRGRQRDPIDAWCKMRRGVTTFMPLKTF